MNPAAVRIRPLSREEAQRLRRLEQEKEQQRRLMAIRRTDAAVRQHDRWSSGR